MTAGGAAGALAPAVVGDGGSARLSVPDVLRGARENLDDPRLGLAVLALEP